jgi:glycosyltransferase involved in cell wall biosynthesis
MSTITFIFPHPVDGPTGGYKVVYEYANRLVADGHKVNIVYSGSLFWRKKSLYFKLTNCVRYIQILLKGYGCRKWFNLDKRVKEQLTFSLNYRHVPKSDIYICTSPYTAMYVKDYPTENKYYFIQGYENWGAVTDKMLRETYHYPLKKIVISKWLQEIIENEEKEKCTLIYNGFNFNDFKEDIKICDKDKHCVTMLYHTIELKGAKYGLEALEIVKKEIPQLRANLFGTPTTPAELPDWITYNQQPSKEKLNEIYNNGGIFIGTSNIEGWGLPIGEAMICGAAVACTNNKGYLEMAKDGETALVSPIRDAQALANNIIRLIKEDELRHRIARNGNEFIKQFDWDSSYEKLKETIGIQ